MSGNANNFRWCHRISFTSALSQNVDPLHLDQVQPLRFRADRERPSMCAAQIPFSLQRPSGTPLRRRRPWRLLRFVRRRLSGRYLRNGIAISDGFVSNRNINHTGIADLKMVLQQHRSAFYGSKARPSAVQWRSDARARRSSCRRAAIYALSAADLLANHLRGWGQGSSLDVSAFL